MSLKTTIQNLRADMKVRQETANAQYQASKVTMHRSRALAVLPVALAFVFMLVSIATPVSATSIVINGTLTQIIDEIVLIIPSLVNLIVNILPAVLVMAICGFVISFLDKILGILKF